MANENHKRLLDPAQGSAAERPDDAVSGLASGGRRRFLGGMAATPIAASLISAIPVFGRTNAAEASAPKRLLGRLLMPSSPEERHLRAFRERVTAALRNFQKPLVDHPNNGDEKDLSPVGLGNFHKALPHNALGEVDPDAYFKLLEAIKRGTNTAYDQVPLGRRRRLVNPQAGLAFDLEGPDAAATFIPPSPAFSSAWRAGEMVEHYWQALLRDVPFDRYDSDPTAAAAIDDLNVLFDFRGPKIGGVVTPQTLFRDPLPGATLGPYMSQFFLHPIPFGAQTIDQRVTAGASGVDFMTSFAGWLAVQNGVNTPPLAGVGPARFINDGRSLSQFVHIDALYQAYFNALLICLANGFPWNPGNPYGQTPEGGAGRPLPPGVPGALTRVAFATFGGPCILALMTEVSTRALKAQWFQKWNVHRTLRPEAYGGAVENVRNGADYPVHSDVLDSAAVDAVLSRYGTYLLPQAFPEGSPNHPSYASGHAVVAGACVTILKCFFDETHVIPNPLVSLPDGSDTAPYLGPDVLTVGGELNKIASNVATGRNIAGVHWRTDAEESLNLGEAVAIGILKDQKHLYAETFNGFTFTKFDGTEITV